MTQMPHLLIVDDDDDIRSLLTNFFKKHSHTVSVAADGATMFATLERHSIDLVILDVMLLGEDGFSLCQRLRAISRVPIIMLTAVTDHTDRTVGLELGADDYVTKPFDQRELLARVKAVLRRTAETPAVPAPSDIRPIMCFGDWCLTSRGESCVPPTTRLCSFLAENSTSYSHSWSTPREC
jgi:two-component system OmpR family response regulator